MKSTCFSTILLFSLLCPSPRHSFGNLIPTKPFFFPTEWSSLVVSLRPWLHLVQKPRRRARGPFKGPCLSTWTKLLILSLPGVDHFLLLPPSTLRIQFKNQELAPPAISPPYLHWYSILLTYSVSLSWNRLLYLCLSCWLAKTDWLFVSFGFWSILNESHATVSGSFSSPTGHPSCVKRCLAFGFQGNSLTSVSLPGITLDWDSHYTLTCFPPSVSIPMPVECSLVRVLYDFFFCLSYLQILEILYGSLSVSAVLLKRQLSVSLPFFLFSPHPSISLSPPIPSQPYIFPNTH